MLLSTPRPLTFFGWIIGLATVLAVLVPFRGADLAYLGGNAPMYDERPSARGPS